MLIDKENLVSYKQAITVTAVSTDKVDLGPNHWMGYSGNDRDIPIFLAIDETFLATGAATLTIDIQSSNDEAFGSGVVTHSTIGPFAKTDLVPADKDMVRHNLAIPAEVKRYLRANYTVATGPFTAGKITLGVTASRQING